MDRGWRGRGYPRRGRGQGQRGQGYPGRGYGRGGQRRGGEGLLMEEDDGRQYQRDRGFPPRPNFTRPIGYKRLEEMVEKDTARDIVMKLAQSRSGLEERLRGDGGKAGSGMTQMLLKVFAKMSGDYGPLNQSLIEILNLIIKYDFDRNIVDFIYENFTNDRRRQDVSHITNALKVMNLLLTVIPKTSEKKVSILVIVLNSVVDGMGAPGEEAREYLQEVTETLEDLKEKQKIKKEKKQERGTSEEFDSQPAPNNFRDITVFPQLDEIKGTEKPFLRRNLIDKAYQNADHYLDVQFRLLREDFIRPLREGINEIMSYGDSDRKGQRFQNVKVYDNVKVEFMKPDQKGILHRIHFSTEKLQKVRWRNTKRLLYGNLLCLSSDTFRNDVLFAVVADRKAEDLEQGFLTVQFVHEEEEDAEDELEDEDELLLLGDEFGGAPIRRERRNARNDKIDMDKVYTMVETEAYFEAYRHVLAGLKETEEIPLERYIVSCVGDMQAPQYLRPSVAGRVMYDFSPIMENGRRVEVLHYDWPSSEELKLDHSQFEALKCALTNELAIIQGPPGTGKTYVGLQIMKILLKNKQRWASGTQADGKLNCPILVVCYTNHALDQFLEGIAEFSSEEQTIVRVGGRCNNEVTKQFALNELRRKKRANKTRGDANAAMRKAIWETRNDLKEIEQKLQANCNKLEASLRCIQRFQELQELMPRSLRDQFYGIDEWSSSQDEVLLSWLGLRGGEEEPDFAQIAQELSSLTQAMLLSMGYSQEDMGRAYHATRIDDMMVLSDWILGQGQRPAGAAAMQGEDNDNEEEDDDEGIKEEADLIQEDRLLDTDEAEYKTTERNVKENEKHVHQLMKQMAALTFEDIGGHIADSDGGGWQQTRHSKKKAKQKIKKELGKTTIMTKDEERRVRDIYILNMEQRWKLYRTWVNRWREQFRVMSGRQIDKYNGLARKLEEYRREEDASIIHVADVVAITTTGAAKYRDLIYKMNCKIVVVEEAAEVLEAHIITAMPLSTKHLILIGDHQQLKPSPTVYQLAKQYNLDTSLFERLIGKIPHVTLSLQHRMRPEIADLIRPNIYRNLLDHDNVKGRPEITGVEKSVFFLSHTVLEESVADGRSKKNQYEADFLVALCKYLIMQGYKTEQITILAMYTGQLFAFRNTMREQISRGVRVTAVDNFQGEENDIILLSLVRSNTEGKVGFLSIDNRICVALSRAKHALYCVGNMELLSWKSPMWRKIVGHLEEKEAIGEALALQCKNHPDKITPVKTAMDFSKVPEGGCGRPCETRLECGHVCPRPCHPDDHSKTKCQKKCDEILPCGHRCKKKCWQDCGICTEKAEKVMPDCGHKQRVRCSQPLSEVLCMENLAVKLSCGHTCTLSCNQAKSPSRSLCTEKCQDVLECDHPCGGNCSNCYQGRLHAPCTKKCNRTLVCGHACTSNCSQCPPCELRCKTQCLHSKCRKKCGEPCVMCRERCTWECPHYKCTNLCSEPCNRPPCNRPCPKQIKRCKHPCIGLCGEPCPKLCRICDKKEVTEIFFGNEDEQDARFVLLEDCGHVFTYESLDHWMEQKEEGNAIKMKECPRCKTAIWRSTRYGKIINKLLNKVNEVKTKIYGDAARAGQDRRRLYTEILTEERKFRDTFMMEINQIKDELKDTVTTGKLVLLEERFRRFQKLSELKEARRKLMMGLASDKYLKLVERDLSYIQRWVLLPRGHTTQQDSESFRRETDRIKEALEYIDIDRKYQKLGISSEFLVQFQMTELKNLLLKSVDPYDDAKKKKVESYFKSIRTKVPGLSSNLGISDTEREMICKAMGFAAKGHWFSCPNGHIYTITECGGAVVTSTCPHCQLEIGGTGHRLLSTNRVATEMDGAGRSAFDVDMERNDIPQDLLDVLRRQGFE